MGKKQRHNFILSEGLTNQMMERINAKEYGFDTKTEFLTYAVMVALKDLDGREGVIHKPTPTEIKLALLSERLDDFPNKTLRDKDLAKVIEDVCGQDKRTFKRYSMLLVKSGYLTVYNSGSLYEGANTVIYAKNRR